MNNRALSLSSRYGFGFAAFFGAMMLLASSVFADSITPVDVSGNPYLKIERTALGKEFLLEASMIPQTLAPTSQGSLSRVVYFKMQGNKVFLMQSAEGQVATKGLPSQIILAEIPVIANEKDALVIDFNEGMKRVFLASNWYASDFQGPWYDPSEQAMAVEVDLGFISSQEQKAPDLTEIRQMVQLNYQNGLMHPTYEMRYYLRPYKSNPKFESKENEDFKSVGYFETSPILEAKTGRDVTNITRWDLSDGKTITFYVSANTPKELVQAVKEGILYWNKAFGREVMKAEIAPEGVTAPDAKYNLVQWVDWDTAGFAYADGLSDPKTGEMMNAQIYLTSAFSFDNPNRIQTIVRQLEEEVAAEEALHATEKVEQKSLKYHDHKNVKAPGAFKHLCKFEMKSHLLKGLKKIATQNLDPKALLRLTQDYIRFVVAHEVGHTLGLRHNFMGKAAANVSIEERNQLFLDYLKDGKEPDQNQVTLSSSVMDYTDLEDDVLSSNMVNKTSGKALDYDALAIKWGYSKAGEVKFDRATAPLFCTDTDIGTYGDCNVFRFGSKPMVDAAYYVNSTSKNISKLFVERFIQAKTAVDARDRKDFAEMPIDARWMAYTLYATIGEQLSWLNAETRSAFIEKRMPFVTGMNQKEVQTKVLLWVNEQIEELGGVDATFFSLIPRVLPTGAVVNPMDPGVITAELQDYLAKVRKTGFIGADGKTSFFTEAEEALILKRGEAYFAQLNVALLSGLLEVYTTAKLDREYLVRGRLAEHGTTSEIEQRIGALANLILFAKSGQSVKGEVTQTSAGNTFKPTLVVDLHAYPHELRLQAAKLLSDELAPSMDWSFEARRAAVTTLKAILENSLGKDFFQLDPSQMGRPIREWYLQQTEIMDILRVQGGCDDLLTPKMPKGGGPDQSKGTGSDPKSLGKEITKENGKDK